ncbi:MAG: protease TldD [Chloroflexi bacterium ADurb.Bin120]|jgi:TldD protein|uniref:Peptidase U62 modulator of DNA gyrase n=1 Tax=Candidatus Brevifilum fermentans TaxID=1986204 RepID=A0A1Y6K4L9_9CHLR|nr:TldD/PmbA family protein [Brevefilum fermentans]MDI9567177.1 TldD/PmbA family protein [Chloroflexota bacterium]OQB87271.1 MAG: protease TldD [Chloroflexi bacterium ADurb.Bin120]SMX53808.1 Peptidase U62 modulator of DNA gyrase [Brevefilum fermentans]HOM66721.1 TldD/PmbA family protein [Brevefilum fermentans]
MQKQIKAQIDRIVSEGAIYADARWYPVEEEEYLAMWNGNLKSASASRESGIGVRVLYKGAWGFSASSDMNNLPGVFENALDNARTAAERVTFPVRLAEKDAIQASFTSPNQIDPFNVTYGEKVGFLKHMDDLLNQPGVAQRIVGLNFMRKQIIYIDSEGSEIEKHIIEVFPSIAVMGMDEEGMAHERTFRPSRLGETRGWETIDQELFTRESERIVRELNQVLKAEPCPKDDRSVILLPGIMFLQTHETIGHALELDRILGYELAFAGGSFVTLDDFGTLRYGSEKLTARADATAVNSPGSFGFDDDGVPAQDNLLIDRGILVGAITGRQMVEEANATARRQIFQGSSGANRATSFFRVPIERMTNINIDPGDDGTLEDIIKNTEKGIVLDGDKSWSIGSNREQFHFATEIGWLVEDGEVTHVVKNATYKGDTLKFYNALSAVGDESTWELKYVDNCSKGQPNQIMQLGHGIPVCRFDDVRIGE